MGSCNSRASGSNTTTTTTATEQHPRRRRSSSPENKRPRLDETRANSDNNNDMSTNDNSSAAAAANANGDDTDLQTLEHDLAEVEQGLTQQRGLLFAETDSPHNAPRAMFDSLGSALTSIRSRLQGLTGSGIGNGGGASEAAAAASPAQPTTPQRRQSEALNALSQRLSTAERAHSTRMPLGLLQQSERALETGSEAAPAAAFMAPPVSQAVARSLSTGTADSSVTAGSSDGETQTKRRRSSVLLASRRHADLHERMDQELHEGVAASIAATLPKTIPEADEEAKSSEFLTTTEGKKKDEDTSDYHDKLDESPSEEIELLLPESTRKQLDQAERRASLKGNHYAYHHMSGSLRVLSQSTSNFDEEDEDETKETTEKDEPSTTPATTTSPYPPLYSWGSLTFQSASCNSAAEAYQIYGNDKDKKSSEDDTTLTQPKMLPPETRLGRSNIASMSVSSTHMAFSTSTGRILICGDNRAGAVDPLQKSVESIPRPMHLELLAMNRVLKVSCGADHTAAMIENKSVLTWGSNQYGQLGHRVHKLTSFVRPAALAFGGRAADIACGDGFTLVLTTRMEVFLCGKEEISGYNALEEREEDGKTPLLRLPEQNSSLQGLPLVHLTAGAKHAVVVTAHGIAYAWGSNESGQCGRMFPKLLHVPVPIAVPKTSHSACPDSTLTTSAALLNWDVWKSGDPISLADDVNIVDAACGNEHTVLVTKTGRLLVCGANAKGQLGVSNDGDSTSFTSVQAVPHPDSRRKFVSAKAGDSHTLLLDDAGAMWHMGNGKSTVERVSLAESDTRIHGITAGGSINLAIAEPSIPVPPPTSAVDRVVSSGVDDLMKAIRLEHDQELQKESGAASPVTLPTTEELARRTEELFRSPAVMNSLFMDPKEIDELYTKLVEGGHTLEVQQKIVSAMEKGMTQSLESLRDARLMYPESVRILLLLLQCPLFQNEIVETESEEKIVTFDERGSLLVLLCETILGLPFEGYKALMAWTTTVYGKELFVPLLVKPLVIQLNRRLKKQQTYGVPVIAGVLRWLQNVSERSDDPLARREDFHCEGIGDLPMETLFEDLAKFRMSTKADRSVHFYLTAYAFLMSPSVKRNLLQIENQLQMVQAAQEGGISYDPATREFMFKPYFVLAIDRKFILQQTLQAVARASSGELRKSLKVVFKGEDGVDAGGVTKEFFQLLVQKLFDVNTGMWKTENQHEIWFNSDCTWNDDGFYLVGVLVGLALYNSVLLDIHFPPVIYRKLLGLPLGLEDMVDADVRNGLKSLLEYEGDDVEEVFCLNFEVTWTVLGQERKKELKPGGASVPVTSSNKEEYVMLYVKWLLVDSVEPQYADFERGFMQVMEGSSLDMLHPDELELLVVGTPELDFMALEKAADYEGGFGTDDAVVKNLWKWVQSATVDTQLKFLKFCTGSGKAPIGGLRELPFIVQRAGPDSEQLPTAHTCFNTLILPDYGDNYDKLDRLMGRAVLECEGFGLQ